LSLTNPEKLKFLKKKPSLEREVSPKMQRFPFISAIFKMLKKLKEWINLATDLHR